MQGGSYDNLVCPNYKMPNAGKLPLSVQKFIG